MELIVTEKDNAARRIAEILGGSDASVEGRGDVNVYRWGDRRVVGLSGHVVGLDFPPEYEEWRDVRPVELVDADVVKRPTQEAIVAALRSLARDADRVVIATDYDREGELIGKEAYELVRQETDVPIDRVRFSSITDREVREAFADRDAIDFDLAAAGEARQEIDLVWGAALTRFLSLSAGRLGEEYISVGRVQSPTLRLLVEREREIEAFEPEDYWELFADLAKDGESDAFEAQYFYREDGTEQERVWDEAAAERAHESLCGAETATVESVRRHTRTDEPPAPFDTTAFIRAAGSLGYSAQRAMSVAEDLYTAGYVTYPRTDNTHYPKDLDERELLERFVDHPNYGDDARRLLEQETVEPTAGETESTDHPPIHPTGELPEGLGDEEWELYELIVRRFFATVAPAAAWAHLRVVTAAGDRSLKANGKRLLDPGYHAVYPYRSADETHLPDVEEGDELAVTDVRLAAKETQPPRRYGQSRLIERMEEMGVGTKATRHTTLQKLYDRGYVEGDPPRPTALARGVIEAVEAFAERIVDEGMTARLERDMTAIAEGEASLEEVTEESRGMLRRVFEGLHDSREEIGERLRESLKADRRLGPCPECGSDLLVRQSHQGSYFVGCDGYPDCRYTLPLPGRGEPQVTDDRCGDHGLSHVRMAAGRDSFVHGCPRCQADRADATPDRVIGACPDCGAEHGGELAIKALRSGSRLAGCTRYPDCEYSLPLPRDGGIEVRERRCEEHDLPELVVDADSDDPWELGCPVCNYREYRARRAPSSLADLDGIGDRTEEKLADAGVASLADLRAADPEALGEAVRGISADRVREWQSELPADDGADRDVDPDPDPDADSEAEVEPEAGTEAGAD